MGREAEPEAQESGCGNEVNASREEQTLEVTVTTKRTVELVVTLLLVTCTHSEGEKDELSGVFYFLDG